MRYGNTSGMWRFHGRSRLLYLTASWLLVLCIGSLLPARIKFALGTRGPAHGLIHLGAFAVMSILLMLWRKTVRQQFALAVLAVAIGVAIEIAEGSLGGNPVELGDVQLDILGVVLAFVVLQFGIVRNLLEILVGFRDRA